MVEFYLLFLGITDLVGTTDDEIESPQVKSKVLEDDREYILNNYLDIPITKNYIVSIYAGLRILVDLNIGNIWKKNL